MRLYEFEGKKAFRLYNIPVPEGRVCENNDDAIETAKEIGFPVMVKAQVLKGGRGKAGGIKVADDENSLKDTLKTMKEKKVCGEKVEKFLVEKKLNVREEYYIGITIDEIKKKNVLLFGKGGVDVEAEPEGIKKIHIDPFVGLQPFLAKTLISKNGVKGKILLKMSDIAVKLYKLYTEMDCVLAEINPLILTEEGAVFAGDARLEIDDDATGRQENNLNKLRIPVREEKTREPTPLELEARRIDRIDHRGVAGRVVEFDGDIALIIGGGGASLTVFDAILRYGGKPANYCEIGGNPTVKKVQKLTELLMKKKGIKALGVITNVLSNTRVDLVARGVIKGLLNSGVELKKFPVIFRVPGSWEEEGFRILEKYGIKYFTREHTMEESAKYLVEMVKKNGDTG